MKTIIFFFSIICVSLAQAEKPSKSEAIAYIKKLDGAYLRGMRSYNVDKEIQKNGNFTVQLQFEENHFYTFKKPNYYFYERGEPKEYSYYAELTKIRYNAISQKHTKILNENELIGFKKEYSEDGEYDKFNGFIVQISIRPGQKYSYFDQWDFDSKPKWQQLTLTKAIEQLPKENKNRKQYVCFDEEHVAKAFVKALKLIAEYSGANKNEYFEE